MKSALTYEMHNYAAMSVSNVPSEVPKKPQTLNSTRVEKYSLRQRQKRKCVGSGTAASRAEARGIGEREPVAASSAALPVAGSTRVRGSRKAEHSAGAAAANVSAAPTGPAVGTAKSKSKSAPLSKYRRKTANARERTRMREINTAFENLKNCVPHTITGEDPGLTNDKLTKITTLRLAMKYIRVLTEVLKNPTFEADFLLECKRDGDFRFTTHAPLAYSPPSLLADHETDETSWSDDRGASAPSPEQKSCPKATPKAKGTKSSTHSRKMPTKRQTKKTKLHQSTAPYSQPAMDESLSSNNSSGTSSLYDILSTGATSPLETLISTTYIPSASQPMSDLSVLMLESDGESLHLSDRCLSPLQSSYATLLGATDMDTSPLSCTLSQNSNNVTSDSMTISSLENPLELSLRFLDSSTDSLLYDQQYPSGCISPLATLESMNPFSDMLHSDLSDNGTLDYFLT